jgi:hypothetical protein
VTGSSSCSSLRQDSHSHPPRLPYPQYLLLPVVANSQHSSMCQDLGFRVVGLGFRIIEILQDYRKAI